MNNNDLKDFLLNRTREKWQFATSMFSSQDDRLNRRQFLSIVGVGGYAASLDINFPSPTVTVDGRAIVVRFANLSWRVDPELFGESTRVSWSHSDETLLIELQDATLPGTDLSLAFVARIFRQYSVWKINLSMPRIRFQAEASLSQWMCGKKLLSCKVPLRKLRLGGKKAKLSGNEALLGVGPAFDVHLEGGEIELRHPEVWACSGTSLVLRPDKRTDLSLRSLVEKRVSGPSTFFSLAGATASETFLLKANKGSHLLGYQPQKVHKCSGELYDLKGGLAGVSIIEGVSCIGRLDDTHDQRRLLRGRIDLERASLLVSSGAAEARTVLAGYVPASLQRIQLGSWSAVISADEERPFFADLSRKNTPITVDVVLHQLNLPIEDGDLSHISADRHPVRIVFGEDVDQKSRQKKASFRLNSGSLIVLGRKFSAADALINLDQATLSVKRSVDCVNLSFEFVNFDLRIRNGLPTLRRRKSKKKAEVFSPAFLVVKFPPQHVAEKYFPFQDPTTLPPDSPPLNKEFAARPVITRARLSGQSRLVFTPIDERKKKPKWVERALTIGALTDWSELVVCVNARALPRGSSLEKQLSVAGINCDMPLEQVVAQIARSFQPPSRLETALEMSGRLILSSSNDARWRASTLAPDQRSAVLWHARLDQEGRRGVRALWSNWFTPGRFPVGLSATGADCGEQSSADLAPTNAVSAHNTGLAAVKPTAVSDELLVLTPSDHWELVAQTSLCGLIAIRNVEQAPAVPPKNQSKKELSTKGSADLRKLSNRVIPPDESFRSVEELAHDPASHVTSEDLGFAVVEPFDDGNIVLTAMGGSLGAEWNGEPFDIPQNSAGLPKPFNLERFVYRSQLGRDIHVETYRKGYLLPLGVRASYVRLSERRFAPHPRHNYPVCYLIQRTFIVIRKPEKAYPAAKQPYGSRDFPVSKLVMLTRITPDLISPCLTSNPSGAKSEIPEDATGRVNLPGLGNDELVFWPRIRLGIPGRSEGDVEFKWSIDDDQTPITSKLLFVSNNVARNWGSLEKVAAYYRGKSEGRTEDEKWDPLVSARLSGTRHRYASPNSSTETAFDSDSWLLSVRGAADQSGSGESFATDSTLEIADQPPIYPVVSRAQIAVQTLDQLMGAPQGLIKVRFWPQYVSNGFSADNPGQIFLEVLSPAIALNTNNNGGATGGLARPNATLAALSRTTGLIGGRDTKIVGASNSVASTSTPQLVGSSSISSGRFDFRNASIGKFDVSEFFAPDAKLLGLVTFKDLIQSIYEISGAPTLLEKYEYGDVAVKVMEELCHTLKDQRTKLNVQLAALVNGVTISDLYPDLSHAIDRLCDTPKPQGNSGVADYLTAIAYKGRELLEQVERVLNEPLPTLASQELASLKETWEQVQKAPTKWANDYVERVYAPVKNLVSNLGRNYDALKLGEELIGIPANIHNPSRWLAEARRSLFAPLLAVPLASAYAKLNAAALTLATSTPQDAGLLLRDSIPVLNDAVTAAFQFADTSASGAVLGLWDPKSSVNDVPALRLVELVSGGLRPKTAAQDDNIGSVEYLLGCAKRLLTIGKTLTVSRPDLKEKLASAKTDFQATVEILNQRLLALQEEIVTLASNWKRFNPQALERSFVSNAEILNSSARIISKRRELAHSLTYVALALPKLELIIKADSGALDNLREAGKQVALLMLLATNIEQIGSDSQTWNDAKDVLDQIAHSLSDVLTPQGCVEASEDNEQVRNSKDPSKTLSACLDKVRSQLEENAKDLYKKLNPQNLSLSDLSNLETKLSLDELSKLDISTQIDGLLTRLYATSFPAISLPLTEAAAQLQAVVSSWGEAATAVQQLCASVSKTVNTIIQLIQTPIVKNLLDPALQPALSELGAILQQDLLRASNVATAFQKSEYSSELNTLKQGLEQATDQKEISRLSHRVAQITADLRDAAHNIQNAVIKTSAGESLSAPYIPFTGIARAWSVFQDILGKALTVKLGTALSRQQLNGIVMAMRDDLRQSLLQLLPTAKEIKYDWSTKLQDFNPPGGFFALTFSKEVSNQLTLSGRDKINFLSGTNEASTSATLCPFQINIAKLVTLNFDGASFDSKNGSAPRLDVKFKDVTLGSGLDFLKALQQFMSPKEGSGPYAIVNSDAVRAGYRYDASVLQVGSLQFIHVSLNVFTHIPLRGISDGDLSAQVGFGFGSEDRPFLIAQPPYGGGGFVELIFRRGKLIPKISLSFGAVVAIHFGPLDGHGRVTSTITWGRNKNDTSDVIKATVEAVGEGHIGCFGISVMLQVGLYYEDGSLTGSAKYSFEFKVGSFLSISFQVTATYAIQGSSSKQSARAQVASPNFTAVDLESLPNFLQVASGKPARPASPTLPAGCTANNGHRRKITLLAPEKVFEWGHYRKRVAMELL